MKIPFNRASILPIDIDLLLEAIESGHISGNGKYTQLSEELITSNLGVLRTLLTTSCTSALEMSALLLNLAKDDEVIMPSFTFVSTANAFALYGARPVFVDANYATLNIDANLIERAITKKTRAICVVHYGGVACEMEKILEIAKMHNLKVIEDNAHGLFGKYCGKYLGTFGSLATQSFHETKNISCGEGGALLINDSDFIERAEILREKGTDRSKFFRGQIDKYTWVDIGSSWVMSDMLSAILYGQLSRCGEIQNRRMKIWNRYKSELQAWADQCGVQLPEVPDHCEHTGHVFHMRFSALQQRDRFIGSLGAEGITATFHYQPLHRSKVGQMFAGVNHSLPVSEHAGDCLVRLPLYDSLSELEQMKVIEATKSFQP